VYEHGLTNPKRLHVEDGCQFLNLYPASKYAVSARQLIEAIADLVTAPEVEVLRFLHLYAVSYIIANGDLHARNVSLLRGLDGRVTLSPTYDLLTTLPYGDARMALKLEGRDQNLERKHFVTAGRRAGVPEAAISRLLDRLTRKAADWVEGVDTIGLKNKAAEHLKRTMHSRLSDLA